MTPDETLVREHPAGLSNGSGWRAAQIGGRIVYAVGDIEGRYDLLIALLKTISADRQRFDGLGAPTLIFCGGYIDHGPESAKVIEALTALERRADYELKFLRGRGEKALLDFLDQPGGAAAWIGSGGDQTLLSYGVTPPSATDDGAALSAARDALLTKMPAAHLRFLERLETLVEIGDYAFVHAGVRSGRPLRDQQADDLLGIGEEFLSDPGPFERVIVHGHSWIDERPRILQHRIGLSTGAHKTGVLTAVRIEDGDICVLQAGSAGAAAP